MIEIVLQTSDHPDALHDGKRTLIVRYGEGNHFVQHPQMVKRER